MIKKIFLIFLIPLILLNLTACKKGKDLPENQIIKYNLDNEPRTLDPQICNDQAATIVIINIFEGLTRLDEDGNIIPGVALNWEISDNGLTYIFHLRKDAYWSNKEKTPVTAHDFVFGFQRALDKKTNSPKAYTLYCIKSARNINLNDGKMDSLGVKAMDDYTLSITLEETNENFLQVLCAPISMPCNKEFFEQSNGQYGLESSTIQGNGAFKVKTRYGWDHYNTITLVKNENYKGENEVIPAGVNFTIGKDISNTVNLINNSTLDAAFLAEDQVNKAIEEKLPMISVKGDLWGITFNTTDQIFSNLNMRLGFLKALNREQILSSLPEHCEIANDIIPNSMMYINQNYRAIAGDKLYLKEDIQARNYVKKGIHEINLKTLPSISILCLDTSSVKTMVSNIIENLNNNLGYYFNMEPMSKSNLMSRIANGNYQIAFVPIVAEGNSVFDLLNIFKSDNKKNISNLNSEEYDRFFNTAISSKFSDSIKHLIKAEKFLNDNAIFYPMYQQTFYFTHSKKLSKLNINKQNKTIDFILATKTK